MKSIPHEVQIFIKGSNHANIYKIWTQKIYRLYHIILWNMPTTNTRTLEKSHHYFMRYMIYRQFLVDVLSILKLCLSFHTGQNYLWPHSNLYLIVSLYFDRMYYFSQNTPEKEASKESRRYNSTVRG